MFDAGHIASQRAGFLTDRQICKSVSSEFRGSSAASPIERKSSLCRRASRYRGSGQVALLPKRVEADCNEFLAGECRPKRLKNIGFFTKTFEKILGHCAARDLRFYHQGRVIKTSKHEGRHSRQDNVDERSADRTDQVWNRLVLIPCLFDENLWLPKYI